MTLPRSLIASPHDNMEVVQECTIREVVVKVDFTQPIMEYLKLTPYGRQMPLGFSRLVLSLTQKVRGVENVRCLLFKFRRDPHTKEIMDTMKANSCSPGGAHEAVGVIIADSISQNYYHALVACGAICKKDVEREYVFALSKRNEIPHVEFIGARKYDGRWSSNNTFLGVPIPI